MKKKLHSALRSRRGISIVETVIALVIVMIVSAAAVSLLAAATRVEGDAVHTAEINEYAESAVECFRWATHSVDFGKAMEQLGFTEPEEKDENIYLYVLERTSYRMEIVAQLDNTLKITAINKGDETIYELTYEK